MKIKHDNPLYAQWSENGVMEIEARMHGCNTCDLHDSQAHSFEDLWSFYPGSVPEICDVFNEEVEVDDYDYETQHVAYRRCKKCLAAEVKS